MKRKLCFTPTKKQLRSRLPRRRRLHISPFPFPATAVDSSDLAPFVTEEISCDSSIASVGNHKALPLDLRRAVTRTYYNSGKCFDSVEFSENSCVESRPGENNGELLKLAEVSKPEVSAASPRYSFADNFINRVNGNENSVIVEIPGEITNSEAIGASVESRAEYVDLTCSEEFSDCSEEENSSSAESKVHALSDLEVGDDSECTPSFRSGASGSQFSGKSIGDESCSPTLQLFSQFKQQFCRSTFASSVRADDDHTSPLLGLEREEDEESYRMLRRRERSQVYLRDYAEEYCNTTDYGELIIRQRLDMVQWIVEQATNEKLQMETMFLGVSLLDRFLSLGYFENMKNLQIAGIACLTLATRIEENQPYNCVLTETFCVGKTTYLRCEVVAMEWLVMEVLNFQCFLPTLYNFLWYYLKAARANKKVEKTTKYLAVLALMGHQQLCFWPSIVAAGVVLLACIAANEGASSRQITAIGAKEKDESLPECIESLEWLVKYL